MDKTVVLGILLGNRVDQAPKFQEIISKHGCVINTRIGLHHAGKHQCPIGGVILLDLIGDDEDINALEDALISLQGIQLEKMVFEHK